jgi:hypothetical protein
MPRAMLVVLLFGALASGCLRNKFDVCLDDPPGDPYCVDGGGAADAGTDAGTDAGAADATGD